MKRHTRIALSALICLAEPHTSQAMFEAITGLGEPTYKTVRLVSSDGKSFALPKNIAFISEFVHTSLTGKFREAAGPAGVITQRGMGDLPRTVHVDIPGKELNILAQLMRLLHEHQGSAKAQADAVARMPEITPQNVGALIHDANLMLLPESCITGLIDRLAECIHQESEAATGLFSRLMGFLYQQDETGKVIEIPFDEPTLLAQLSRTYFLKYDQELELADADGNSIDIGGFSIRELLDAGKKFRIHYQFGAFECDLGNRRINSLDGLLDIPEIDKCQRLLLNKNQISSIQSGAFQGLSNLEELQLDNNKITSIQPNSFQGLTSLRHLYLTYNRLTTLSPDTFQGLSNLEWLYLYNNQIASIPPDAFRGLSNLKKLRLDNNQITSIQRGTFQGLPNLNILFLHDNQITSIQKGTFQGLPNLNELFLEGNKLSPDTIEEVREKLPPDCELYTQNQQADTPEERRKKLAEAAERRMRQQ